jgi:heme a synthase
VRGGATAWLSGAALLIALVQGGLGTQVRGLIEDIARANPDLARSLWLDQVGVVDIGHRNLALLCVALVMMTLLSARSRERSQPSSGMAPAWVAVIAVVGQFALGLSLAYAALPRVAQVLHLLLATILLGALTLVWLRSVWRPLRAMTTN